MKTSIIVTTYNQPQHLDQVLTALSRQTHKEFEVIIADDGSTQETFELIHQKRRSGLPFSLQHFWQPDQGFRVGEARNGAIRLSTGDWLIFLDGDMVVHPQFVESHLRLAQTNRLLFGGRVKMNPDFSAPEERYSSVTEGLGSAFGGWLVQNFAGKQHPYGNFLLNALGSVLPRHTFFKICFKSGCNFSTSRTLIEKVNGFDPRFNGLSGEDGELFWRLLHAGAKPRSVLFTAIAHHLWHPENWQRAGEERQRSLRMEKETRENRRVRCEIGLVI